MLKYLQTYYKAYFLCHKTDDKQVEKHKNKKHIHIGNKKICRIMTYLLLLLKHWRGITDFSQWKQWLLVGLVFCDSLRSLQIIKEVNHFDKDKKLQVVETEHELCYDDPWGAEKGDTAYSILWSQAVRVSVSAQIPND